MVWLSNDTQNYIAFCVRQRIDELRKAIKRYASPARQKELTELEQK